MDCFCPDESSINDRINTGPPTGKDGVRCNMGPSLTGMREFLSEEYGKEIPKGTFQRWTRQYSAFHMVQVEDSYWTHVDSLRWGYKTAQNCAQYGKQERIKKGLKRGKNKPFQTDQS